MPPTASWCRRSSALLGLTIGAATAVGAQLVAERRRADAEHHRREQAQKLIVQTLTTLTATRDADTGRHARRTQEYVRLLAATLASSPLYRRVLTPERIELIATLAPLHDIGKVGIPDARPEQAGAPHRRRVRRDEAARRARPREPAARRAPRRRARRRSDRAGQGHRLHAPRALGRLGLPARAARHGDPAGRAAGRGGRRLRRAGRGARLQAGDGAGPGPRHHRCRPRHPLRPRHRRRVPRCFKRLQVVRPSALRANPAGRPLVARR